MPTDCYYPSAPDNGGVELLLPGITTYPGAVAAQSCNNGYVLTGNKTIVCQANGLWTHSVSCIKNGLYTFYLVSQRHHPCSVLKFYWTHNVYPASMT